MYLLLVSLILGLSVFWRLYIKNKTTDNPPVLSGGFPVIGHSYKLFLGDNIETQEKINKVSQECVKRGGILSGSFMHKQAYCLTDPDAIETVVQSCLDKIYVYDIASNLVGPGIITCHAETWKRYRKFLNPAFGQQFFNSFIPNFNYQSRRLVEQLVFQLGKPSDHEKIVKQNQLESACITVTGVGSDEYSGLQAQYLTFFQKFHDLLDERLRQLWYHSDFIYKFSNLKKRAEFTVDSCSNLLDKMIQQKKEEIKANHKTKQTTNSKAKNESILELILNQSIGKSYGDDSLTDEEIKCNLNTLIVATYETSASVLNTAMMVLGSYPEIQEKLYKEVMDVLGNSDRDLDKNDVNKLVYTEAVLKETLRLYAPFPMIARHIDKDIKLKNYTLKANSLCFVFLNGLNRHPDWGSDVDQFKPERWLDANTLPGKKYFGSFAIGKRSCSGKAYAMISMKITLAHVIRSYHISADIRNVVFKWLVLSFPASGHHYVLQHRKKH